MSIRMVLWTLLVLAAVSQIQAQLEKEDPCCDILCPNNGICSVDIEMRPSCGCREICSKIYEPICASDGLTYSNFCVFERESCNYSMDLSMIHPGQCKDEESLVRDEDLPGPEFVADGSYASQCLGKKCEYHGKCRVKKDNPDETECVCRELCGYIHSPICASNNHTYECMMYSSACKGRLNITMVHGGGCNSTSNL